MGAHWNRLGEVILMSTHNIGFYEDLTKIIFELSSNMHLISSADMYNTLKALKNKEVYTCMCS